MASAVADVAQTFTGTGGIFATDLVDLGSFDVATVTGSVDLASIVNGGGAAADATPAATTPAAAPAADATEAADDDGAEDDDSDECLVDTPTTAAPVATQTASPTVSSPAAGQATEAAGGAASGTNIQAFTGTLGGPAPPVESTSGDRPFSVNGNTFTGEGAAISRSCDIQHNACANAANSGELDGGIAQCEQQVADCKAANGV